MKLQLQQNWFALAGLVVAFLFSLINLSCDVLGLGSDSGLEEDFFARVQGKIHITGVPPEQTDELFLALVKGTSPKFTTTIPRIDLNLQASEQYIDYIIEAQADTFDALFAIWKERGRPLSVIEDIVGSYCEEGALIPLQIATNDTIVNIDTVDVNMEKVNRVAGVSGIIQFKGTTPDNIDNLGVVFADPKFLIGGFDVCDLLSSMDIRLLATAPVDSLPVSMPVNFKISPGVTLILVAWNRIGESLFNPILIGLSGVEAIADTTIQNIELIADFDNPIEIGGLFNQGL